MSNEPEFIDRMGQKIIQFIPPDGKLSGWIVETGKHPPEHDGGGDFHDVLGWGLLESGELIPFIQDNGFGLPVRADNTGWVFYHCIPPDMVKDQIWEKAREYQIKGEDENE